MTKTYGPTTRLRVTFTAGRFEESHANSPLMLRERLSAFVSEGGNPHNISGASRVEVFLPSKLLARGLVLIDTPGRAAADFLAGDRLRAFAELEQDAEKLRIQGRETLVSELDRTLGGGGDAEQARAALAATLIQYFDAALAQTISEVGKRLATTLHAHQDRADKLIAAVRRTAADLLEIPFRAPESSDSLEVRHDPFWVTSARTELLGAIAPRVLDRFLPQATRQVRSRRRLVKEIEAALLRNVENLRWATRQNLEDTFRRGFR